MRRGWSLFVIAVLAQVAFAGCLEDVGENADARARRLGQGVTSGALSFDPSWYELALPNGDDHNHRDLAQHANRSTANFDILGWDPLITNYHGKAAGGYFCGDVSAKKDGRQLAVVHSWVSDVGFLLLDITDPTAPRVLSEFVLDNSHVYDLAITEDQNYVLLGTIQDGQGPDTTGPLPVETSAPLLRVRDACTGKETVSAGPEQGLPFASGLVLVDITNPRNPTIADFRHFPVLGSHSVVSAELSGRTIVVSTVENIPGELSYYVFLEIIDTPAGAKLQMLTIWSRAEASPSETGKLQWNNHDVFLQEHPVTGADIAYLADGRNGIIVLNVDDPSQPEKIGAWSDWDLVGGPAASHYIHETMPIEGTWDGKHYTFMGEECTSHPEGTPTCLIYAMDTTEPSKPTMVGAWTLPFDSGVWAYPGFSVHYMAIVNRTLFVSAFHAGVWAVDVSSEENLRAMPTIGVFLPDKVPPQGFLKDHNYHRSPATADVIATGDGNLVTFDETSGVYVLKFDASRPAPAPTPWKIPGTFYAEG
jgi:hypothetical protein